MARVRGLHDQVAAGPVMLLLVVLLVLERDHFVPGRGHPGRPGERGRGGAQSGRRQRRRDLLHLDGRAQVVRARAPRYKVLGDDAAVGVVSGRGPVVAAADHGLLNGAPAGRLALERWWGRWQRHAVADPRPAATVTSAVVQQPVVKVVVQVVESGRRQQLRELLLRRRRRRRRQRFQVDGHHTAVGGRDSGHGQRGWWWRWGRGLRPKVPVSGAHGRPVVATVVLQPAAVVLLRRGRLRGADAAGAVVVHACHGAHDNVLLLPRMLLMRRRKPPPPTAAPPAVSGHGGQLVLQQLEAHGHHGHADQYVAGRHEHGHVLGGLDAAGHELAEPDGAQAGEAEVRALQQRPPLQLLVDERAQRHVRADHGQREQHGHALLATGRGAARHGGRGVRVRRRARHRLELVPVPVVVGRAAATAVAAYVVAGHRVGRRSLAAAVAGPAASAAAAAAVVVPVVAG